MKSESKVTLTALEGLPIVDAASNIPMLIQASLDAAGLTLADGDVLVVTSKLFSRKESCFVDLSSVTPSVRAVALAEEVDKDARLVELILQDSVAISRKRRGVLIVRHRLGFISANAAIDASNAMPKDAAVGSGPWVLRMPKDPDASAEQLRCAFPDVQLGVVVSDSLGRPFRLGTVGAAVGVAGLSPLLDQRGACDLHGRALQCTLTALADQLAAAADMVAGQSDEGRPVVHIRGVAFVGASDVSASDVPAKHSAKELLRDPALDLYA